MLQHIALRPGTTIRRINLVEEVCSYIRNNPSSRMTLAGLGGRFGVSPFFLQRTFVEVMGISPRRYLEECRIKLLKLKLAKGEPVIGALRRTGYSSQSWLYKDSRAKLGMTPANYRAGGVGRRVIYSIGETKLGRLLVAATNKGICSVNVSDDEDKLLSALRQEYPKARIVRSREADHLLQGVRDHLKGQEVRLPLDIRGTDFQLRVWAAIQRIPLGATRSYSDVAEMVGKPKAIRAVANACGSNPVPLIIPCHRVIRKDGTVGGYGLGTYRKEMLLSTERWQAKSGRRSTKSMRRVRTD